jgi:chromosome segregation ATPase
MLKQPEPVIAEPMPEPRPEPVKAEARPEPIVETKPEPVKAEPKPEPVAVQPAVDIQAFNLLKAQLEKQIAEQEKQRKEIDEYHGLLKQQDNLASLVMVLQAKLDRMEAERMAMPAPQPVIMPDTNRLEEQIRENRTMIDAQKLTVEVQKDTIARLEDDLDKIKAFDLEDFSTQEKQILQKIAVELKGLKTTVVEYDNRFNEISGKIGAIGVELSATKDRTENIEQDAFAARRAMEENTKTLESFKTNIAEQTAGVEQMKNSVSILDSKVNSLRDSVVTGPAEKTTEEMEALKAQMSGWGDDSGRCASRLIRSAAGSRTSR